ncbi:MAG: hypothetical protein DRJ02_12900, partial [Bacteroidetes bacterium]
KGNIYSDERLTEHQALLFTLYNRIFNDLYSDVIDFSSPVQIKNVKKLFEFIEINITYLEDSTLNQIPFETVFCLQKALTEWSVTDGVEYIIVTTLRYNNYFFHGLLAFEDNIYQFIEALFGIKFKYRLIQISIPNKDVNDYFLNSVLYHELGHFIDIKYRITQRIIDSKYPGMSDDKIREERNHLGEYFADIFAAQYSPLSIQNTLQFSAQDYPKSFSHPSTSDRLNLIDNFTKGSKNETIDLLNYSTNITVKKKLEKRYTDIDYSDFYNLIPPIINNEIELHGLFNALWDIWRNSRKEFDKMDDEIIYKVLNNLVEKSIGNYLVKEEWEAHAPAKR